MRASGDVCDWLIVVRAGLTKLEGHQAWEERGVFAKE